jgi:signal transduction histidine kinase
MEERVRLLNGTFSVHSQAGKGSTLEVVVPIGILKDGEPPDRSAAVG